MTRDTEMMLVGNGDGLDEKTSPSNAKQSLFTTWKLFASQNCKPDLYNVPKNTHLHRHLHSQTRHTLPTDDISIEFCGFTMSVKVITEDETSFDTSRRSIDAQSETSSSSVPFDVP